MNILLVEDDPIIAADLEDRLRDAGYEPLPAIASGEAALDWLEKNSAQNQPSPDLALLDVQLEGELDGIETARLLAQKYPKLPYIFLTANSDDATFNRAKTTRPAAFLSKPFRGRDLRHAIELAVGQSSRTETAPLPDLPRAEAASFLFDDRLFVKMKDRMVRVFFEDILWAEADDYYCKIATSERELLISQTLGKLGELLLLMPQFVRVHRSFIVNLRHVEQIGDLHLFIGKKQIPLTRTAREELLAHLQKV